MMLFYGNSLSRKVLDIFEALATVVCNEKSGPEVSEICYSDM